MELHFDTIRPLSQRSRKWYKTLTLLAMMLVVGVSGVMGQSEQVIYSTGFESAEGFAASTTYNNTTVKYQGPTGQQWG